MQDWEVMRRLPRLLTQFPGPSVHLSSFGSRIAFGDHQRSAQGDVEREFLLETLGSLRQSLEYLQSLHEMTDSFEIGRPLDGLLAGPLPITNRLCTEPCLRVMIRYQLRLSLDRLGKPLFQHLGNALVILLTGASEQRLICCILNERMLKRIHSLGA